MQRFSRIFRRDRSVRGIAPGAVSSRGGRRRRRMWGAGVESLERRAMMAVDVTTNAGGDEVYILYNQTGADGSVTTANQNVIVEVENLFFPFTVTRVNVYVPSNPLVLTPPPGAPVQTYSFTGVSRIFVDVPTADDPGVNNNSLTIKGITEVDDRIIVAGSGRTASARWSDETADELQVLFDIEGIDDLTVTAGGIINVSGVFSNDTQDASITVIATVPEDSEAQLTGTVVVAEATPVGGILPQPRLESNFIQVIGAELDILGDIVSTDQVILRAGENAPDGSRSHLVLPYDVTVSGNPVTAAAGVLELFSTKNIEQLPSSTLQASRLVAVSNNANVATLGGPWMINLGTETNDFDSISLGMTSAPGDAANPATEGRIAVRDVDDLVVADFGILAVTGQVRLDVGGALTIAAPIQATGLIVESDDSVSSTAGAVMRIGDLGLSVLANAVFGAGSTGDVTLAGPITVVDTDTTAIVTNKITAAGTVSVSGGFYSPHAGSTTFSGKTGVAVGGPVQLGSTKLASDGTAVAILDHNLELLSSAGTVSVANAPGNDATPFAVQTTNIISIDAVDDVTIEGAVFAGTIYGNPSALTATSVLPSISIRGLAAVNVTPTGSLRTQAYQTDPDKTSNPMVGKITIRDASQVNAAGPITADGAVDISVVGDVSLVGTTARENVVVRTSTGSISVQGPMASTGGTYTTAPAAGSQREPNVILDAPLGAISTSGAGTLTAGVVNGTLFGKVLLTAQQGISIGAEVNTPGVFTATSKLGAFDLSALLQTNNQSAITINTGNGMLESDLDFARIVTSSLVLLNTGAAGGVSDIDLQAKDNQIATVTATNLSVGGDIRIANNAALAVGAAGLIAQRDTTNPSQIELVSTAGITQSGRLQANELSVTGSSPAAISLGNPGNNIDRLAATNPTGGFSYVDTDDFATGLAGAVAPVLFVTVTNGGSNYVPSSTSVTIAAPADPAGVAATARAIVVGGVVTGIAIVTPGSGYVDGEAPTVTISGVGSGASAMGAVLDKPAVAIAAQSINLASVEAHSIIRVVGGLSYARGPNGAPSSLTIAAGTSSATTVGTVEFVTTATGDNPSAVPGVPAPFAGTLRDMILYANDNTAIVGIDRHQQPQSMVFDEAGFPVDVITVAAALPQFTRRVTLDGGRLEATVSADRLGLQGNPGAETGLAFGLGSGGSRISTVAAYGFGAGSAIALLSGGNVVTDVYAGLEADGVTVSPNRVGIDVNGRGAVGNVIGDRVFDEGLVNKISGNKAAGIVIRNGASGTNVSGNRIFNNLGDGIRITNAVGNLIGDPKAVQPDLTPADSNVISGNKSNGILVLNSNPGTYTNANRIRNNLIEANEGVNIGTGAGAGIGIRGSKFVVVGGPTEGGGNTIANQGPSAGVNGIAVADSTDVRVIGIGNLIGVKLVDADADGVADFVRAPNSGDGINIVRSQRVEISDRNTIAGNAGNGIGIGTGSSAVTVLGNSIGLTAIDPTRSDLGNTLSGVAINDAIGNTVGAGNAIAFNGLHGVNVTNARAATLAAGNRVLGTEIFANFQDGIRINGGSGTTIGGTKAGNANVIRGNFGSGIRLERTVATGAATGHAIQGNLIGTNVNRDVDAALGNGGAGIRIVSGTANTVANGNVVMNNAGSGIELLGGTGNIVGGATVAAGNTISNNSGSGLRVGAATGTLATARAHVVGGNAILENAGDGVLVDGTGVTGLAIGQQVSGTKVNGLANQIQGNGGVGIRVGAGAQQVSFQGNSIADNLAGAVSVGAGANRSTAQSLSLSTAVLRGVGASQSVTVTGTLANARYPQQQYSIDVYANRPDDGDYASLTGYQARRYLGRATVMTDSRGNATFSLRITAPLEVGEVITAMASSLRFETGSTSVLSNAVTADLPGIPTPRF
jgi:hypothetical protein